MDLEYTKIGDYYYPNLIPNQEPEEPLTKYGDLRHEYLRQHRRGTFWAMLLEGELKEHCLEIQHQADERLNFLIEEMVKSQGITEQLKEQDQMLWVQKMNNIKNAAEEIVLREIVYI